MHILIVKLSSMGDVIHTLPALSDAQKAIPDIQFDWVIEPAFAEIPSWHTAVHNIIPMALRDWRKHPIEAIQSKAITQFYKTLIQKKYDVIIDAQGLIKSAIVAACAQGVIAGYDKRSTREYIASFCYHQKYSVDKNQHAIARARELFSKILKYDFDHTALDYQIFSKKLSPLTVDIPTKYVVFLHGTTRPQKHYAEIHWRYLLKKLAEIEMPVFLLWGNDHEKMRAERLATYHHQATVLPKLSLSEIAALLKNATAVISVDTGLGHLSAALATPTISLYGPTDPKKIGTVGKNQIHLQTNAVSDEINIDPSQIWEILCALIKKNSSNF